MNAEAIVSLLEQNWNRLRDELGDQWADFTGSYQEIVSRLRGRSTHENLERALDEICDLLNRYEFGRGLLRGYQGRLSDQTRSPKSANEVLDDQEQVQQVCNRLTELITSKQEQREKEDGKSNLESGKDRR